MYLNVSGRATVARCLTFIFISCMWPKHAAKDTHLIIFSTHFYALEHVHVAQIWIMHINAKKTQLMYKSVQANLKKSKKLTQHSCCSMLTLEIFWKQVEATDIVSSPEVARSLPKSLGLLWEKLWFARSVYPNLPQMGKYVYHGMSMPFHDIMSGFMNFRWVFNLLKFKTMYLNVSGRATVSRCLTFILISCMWPKLATKDKYLILQLVFMD